MPTVDVSCVADGQVTVDVVWPVVGHHVAVAVFADGERVRIDEYTSGPDVQVLRPYPIEVSTRTVAVSAWDVDTGDETTVERRLAACELPFTGPFDQLTPVGLVLAGLGLLAVLKAREADSV